LMILLMPMVSSSRGDMSKFGVLELFFD
jgi:hypothetical protein